MNFVTVTLHKAIIVPASAQLAIRQKQCMLNAATIQQPLTGTKHYQNDIIRYLPESQLNCDSGGMPPMAIGSQAPPHMDIGNPPFRVPYGTRHVHAEDRLAMPANSSAVELTA
jgi:hypothetical protein